MNLQDTVFGTAQNASGISALASLLKIPSHLPAIGIVTNRVLACLRSVVQYIDPPNQSLSELIDLLAQLEASESKPSSPVLGFGLQNEYAVWGLLAGKAFVPHAAILESIGSALAAAHLRGSPVKASLARDLKHLINQAADGVLEQDAFQLAIEKIAAKERKKLLDCLQLSQQGMDAPEINQRVRIDSALSARLSSMRTVERQAAGRNNELQPNQLLFAVEDLYKKAGVGCGTSVAKLVAFCSGLPWHVALGIGLLQPASTANSGCWIDLNGWIHTDLSTVLKKMGKAKGDKFLPVNHVLVRPLPIQLTQILVNACIANPRLQTVGDLLAEPIWSRRKLHLNDVHQSSSISQLLKSAPRAALAAGVPRDVAAFSTLGFELVTESDLHYLTVSQSSIWQACDSLYRSVGLGSAIPMDSPNQSFVGSSRTPESQWIHDIFADSQTKLDQARCGRRYTLSSLIEFHNLFASHAYLYLQLCAAGRDRKYPEFSAAFWHPASSSGLIRDKPLGETQGFTLLPLSSRLALQIGYWRAHLRCLLRRLHKLNVTSFHEVESRVRKILDQHDVNLLFVLDERCRVADFNSDKTFVRNASSLNKDFGRHFWPQVFRAEGLAFDVTQDLLRHSASGVSNHYATSANTNWRHLERAATVIDITLIQLSIAPQHGLVQEAA